MRKQINFFDTKHDWDTLSHPNALYLKRKGSNDLYLENRSYKKPGFLTSLRRFFSSRFHYDFKKIAALANRVALFSPMTKNDAARSNEELDIYAHNMKGVLKKVKSYNSKVDKKLKNCFLKFLNDIGIINLKKISDKDIKDIKARVTEIDIKLGRDSAAFEDLINNINDPLKEKSVAEMMSAFKGFGPAAQENWVDKLKNDENLKAKFIAFAEHLFTKKHVISFPDAQIYHKNEDNIKIYFEKKTADKHLELCDPKTKQYIADKFSWIEDISIFLKPKFEELTESEKLKWIDKVEELTTGQYSKADEERQKGYLKDFHILYKREGADQEIITEFVTEATLLLNLAEIFDAIHPILASLNIDKYKEIHAQLKTFQQLKPFDALFQEACFINGTDADEIDDFQLTSLYIGDVYTKKAFHCLETLYSVRFREEQHRGELYPITRKYKLNKDAKIMDLHVDAGLKTIRDLKEKNIYCRMQYLNYLNQYVKTNFQALLDKKFIELKNPDLYRGL